MRRFAVVAAAVAVAATVSGCKSIAKATFAEPVVSLRELRLNGIGFSGGSLDVVLNVYNPNRFNLNGKRLSYRLALDSVEFGHGELSQEFMVQENDTAQVRLPIEFSWAGVGAGARQLLDRGTLNYRVSGEVTVGTPLGDFTRPYDRTGSYAPLRGR